MVADRIGPFVPAMLGKQFHKNQGKTRIPSFESKIGRSTVEVSLMCSSTSKSNNNDRNQNVGNTRKVMINLESTLFNRNHSYG